MKLELFNPAGSVKDRVAKNMVEEAERQGILKRGGTIIEPTSGNTGIGLASIAASKGYRAIFTMPETMSVERRKLLQGYGAEIVLTDGKKGTITGTGEYLKEKNPALKVIAVEPAASPVLSGGKPGPHGLQGIGAGFIPEILNTEIYDEIVQVENDEAYAASRMLAHKEGVLIGITSGAALHTAIELAKREENAGKTIVAILPDTGERYLSTPLFEV